MELIPADLRSQLPPLYSQDGNPDAIAYVKLFTPDANWTWFVTEFDGQNTCFGLVRAQYEELGYFTLSELQALRGELGLKIERDLYFQPTPLSQLRKQGRA